MDNYETFYIEKVEDFEKLQVGDLILISFKDNHKLLTGDKGFLVMELGPMPTDGYGRDIGIYSYDFNIKKYEESRFWIAEGSWHCYKVMRLKNVTTKTRS